MSEAREAAILASADRYRDVCLEHEAAELMLAETSGAWRLAVERDDWSSPEAKAAHAARDAANAEVQRLCRERVEALKALGEAARVGR